MDEAIARFKTFITCEDMFKYISAHYEATCRRAILDLENKALALDWLAWHPNSAPPSPAMLAVIENGLREYRMYFTNGGTVVSWAEPRPARPVIACLRCNVPTTLVDLRGVGYVLLVSSAFSRAAPQVL
jgi:hypothetical protein